MGRPAIESAASDQSPHWHISFHNCLGRMPTAPPAQMRGALFSSPSTLRPQLQRALEPGVRRAAVSSSSPCFLPPHAPMLTRSPSLERRTAGYNRCHSAMSNANRGTKDMPSASYKPAFNAACAAWYAIGCAQRGVEASLGLRSVGGWD